MSKRVLLVDDSITIQKVAQICLADRDVVLDIASNGDEAMGLAQQNPPDLVVIDSKLGSEDGLALGQNLSNQDSLRQTPKLLLYSSYGSLDEEAAENAGFSAWCGKPFDLQTFVEKVDSSLEAAPPSPLEVAPAAETIATPAIDIEPQAEPAVAEEPEPEFDLGAMFEPETEETPMSSVEEMAPIEEAAPSFELPAEEPQPIAVEPASAAPTAGEEWGDVAFNQGDLADDATDEPVSPLSLQDEPTPEVEFDDIGGFDAEQELVTEEPEMEEPVELPEPSILDSEPAVASFVTPAIAAQEEPQLEEDEILELTEADILAVEPLSPPAAAAFTEPEPAFTEPEPAFTEPEPAFTEPEPAFTEPEPAFAEPEPVAEPPVSVGTATPDDVRFDEPVFAEAEAEAETIVDPEAVVAPVAATTENLEAQLKALPADELRQLLEKVARPMLEQIAWEVVPDLAESLIREEIRKIKESAA